MINWFQAKLNWVIIFHHYRQDSREEEANILGNLLWYLRFIWYIAMGNYHIIMGVAFFWWICYWWYFWSKKSSIHALGSTNFPITFYSQDLSFPNFNQLTLLLHSIISYSTENPSIYLWISIITNTLIS